MKLRIAVVGCAWFGVLILTAQMDWPVQAQTAVGNIETKHVPTPAWAYHVMGWPVQAKTTTQLQHEGWTPTGIYSVAAEAQHPQPMSLPTGIDIVQTVRAHDGTFLLSCTNGRILWAQRADTHSWTIGWIESEWEDEAEGNDWTLLTADREVWAHDSRKLIRVWE